MRGGKIAQSAKMPEPGYETAFAFRNMGPSERFSFPGNVACEVDPPHLFCAIALARVITEDGKRDQDFGDPSLRGDAGVHVPDDVPGRVLPFTVVVLDDIHFDAGHVEGKLVRGSRIVKGIDPDRSDVRFRFVIAPGKPPDDPRRLAVMIDAPEIQGVGIVQDADLRRLRGRSAVVRIALDEVCGRRCCCPCRFRKQAIDHGNRGNADCCHCAGIIARNGCSGHRTPQECKKKQNSQNQTSEGREVWSKIVIADLRNNAVDEFTLFPYLCVFISPDHNVRIHVA